MNIKSLVALAVEEASKSNYKQKVGCVIFNKKNIISTGHNYSQRSVKSLLKKYQPWEGSVHAEVCAVINAKTDVSRMSMIVVRINNQGQLRLANPCKHCRAYLKYVGIKKIYYSTNDETIKIEKVM